MEVLSKSEYIQLLDIALSLADQLNEQLDQIGDYLKGSHHVAIPINPRECKVTPR